MKSILKELFEGAVFPDELICSEEPEYHDINKHIEEEKEYLMNKITEEDRQHLENLDSLFCQSSTIHAADSFVYGFRLATLIMIEVYYGSGKISHNDD